MDDQKMQLDRNSEFGLFTLLTNKKKPTPDRKKVNKNTLNIKIIFFVDEMQLSKKKLTHLDL